MKNQNKNYNSLQGKFLISTPNINDTVFKKSLIYIISDNVDGSMGIIVNKLAYKVSLTSLSGENIKNIIQQPQVYYGGPVELNKGFILHTNDYENDKNHIKLDNGLILSSDFSTIKEISLGGGPSKSILAIGYAGWSSFQLHAELKKNDWFVLNLDTDIIFARNHRKKWDQAISKLGINKKLLQNAIFSNYSGSA
jgi:putative transcriptional regulator